MIDVGNNNCGDNDTRTCASGLWRKEDPARGIKFIDKDSRSNKDSQPDMQGIRASDCLEGIKERHVSSPLFQKCELYSLIYFGMC